jgi:hypothetical protein
MKHIPGRGKNSCCKDPEAGVGLDCVGEGSCDCPATVEIVRREIGVAMGTIVKGLMGCW